MSLTHCDISRRTAMASAAAVSLSLAISGQSAPAVASMEGTDWALWPALPLAPYGERKTVMREAVAGKAYVFDQMLGVFYVHVPIRMSVIAMDAGGLFIFAPIAPTKECLALLQPLIDEHGPVKHIVLPSVAPEHKVLAGPFARTFPQAEFWMTDGQYSFPIDLPPSWLGLPARRINVLQRSSRDGARPFGDEFEHEVLTAKASANSLYQDVAVFHRPSSSLLLVDAVQSISAEPPQILTAEPRYRRALLYHARDEPLERVADSPEVWRKGWQRIALFANFFMPGSLLMLDAKQYLPDALRTPMPELGWAGVLPFTWDASTPEAFGALSGGGAAAVAPIIQIILSRSPEASTRWVSTVCSWPFSTVLPCHFDAPLQLTPSQLRAAFAFLDSRTNAVRYCDKDVAFLRDALEGLPPDLALFPTPFGPLQGTACYASNRDV